MARCMECRRIRSSSRYTQLSKRVVAEEPICWLQLDGCTHRSTSMDHVVPLHTDHSQGLVRSNCRGACHNCNTWRARRSLRQTAILRTRKRPTISRRPGPRPALRPALRWFGATIRQQTKHRATQPYWRTPNQVQHNRFGYNHTYPTRVWPAIQLSVQRYDLSVQRCDNEHRSAKHSLRETKQSLRSNRNRYLVTKHPLRAILAISTRMGSISAKMSSCGPIPCGGMKRANYA
jgi:hypothetical protein